MDDISSIVWDTGWIFPLTKFLSGRVTSILSFSNFLFISVFSISFILKLIKLCSSSFIIFKSAANFFLSFSAIEPIFLNCYEINPFFPNKSDFILFISERFNF